MRTFLLTTLALLGAPAFLQGQQSVEEQLADLSRRLTNIESVLGPMPDVHAAIDGMKAQLDKQAKDNLAVTWKDGLRFENKDVQLKIGGRLHVDMAQGDADSDVTDGAGTFEDGVKFRRARIGLEGKAYKRFEWKVYFDFGNGKGDGTFRDVYMKFNELPVVENLYVGQFKEPYSLEEQTSSNFIPFIERALPSSLVPSRNTGLMTQHVTEDKRMQWAVGWFRNSGTFGGDTDGFGDDIEDGATAVTARLTGLPIWEREGEQLLHVGVGASRRSPNGDMIRFTARPESSIMPTLIDTGALMTEGVDLVNLEAAWVNGRFSLQGEMMEAEVDGDTSADPDPTFEGNYVMASWFFTGERRPYNQATAVFDRVVPNEPWIGTNNGVSGLGALEGLVRLSNLDLDDDGVQGGELDDVTLGLNWYLSRNTRIMFNWIMPEVDDGKGGADGDGDVFALRFATDF